MGKKRKAGQTRATYDGVDEHAGAHSRRRRRVAKSEDATADRPDPTDLDRRDRRQSSKRKAAGPTRAPTAEARPTGPAPSAPPPTDPE
jgi:hypothetical protein